MAKDWGPSEEQKKIFASHGRNIDGSRIQERQTMGGSGGKGGGRPDISPSEVNKSKYNTDKSYGYYNAAGTYVPWYVDIRDGGGMNQSGNYFVGGGLVSGLLNAAKVRPAGAAREMRDGQYVVPIEDIGYRDTKDMYDRGGPQASGGEFQGGGQLSTLANLAYSLSGQEFGERTPYEKVQAQAVITSTNGAIPDATRNAISSLRPMQYSGRGNVGMPRSGMEYSGRGNAAMPSAVSAYPNMSMPAIQADTTPPAPQPPAPMPPTATSVAPAINPLPIQTVEAGLQAGRELERASDDANWDAGLPRQPDTLAIGDLHSEIARAQRGEPPFLLGVGQNMNVNQLSALMPPTAEGDFGFQAFVENQRQVDQLLGKTTTTEEMLERYRTMRGRY